MKICRAPRHDARASTARIRLNAPAALNRHGTRTSRCLLCLSLLLGAVSAPAQDDADKRDYPTIERVLFVEACVREHPDRQRTEMLYKCSCAMDVISGALAYGEYVDASTAFFASQVAGQRGAEVRDSTAVKSLSERYRDARSLALKNCMIE